MVARDVANDREPEAGPTGAARPRPVDAVEALEDPVEVTARDADAGIGDAQLHRPVRAGPRRGEDDLGPRRRVLDRVVQQVEQCRDELAPIDVDPQRGIGIDDDGDLRLVRSRSDAADRLAEHGHDVEVAELGVVAELDAAQLQQVVDRGAGPVGLRDHPLGESGDDVGVGLVADRLGQQAERADRRLELVADVGDEVPSDRLGPLLQRAVVDQGQPTRLAPVVEGVGGDEEGLRRRPEQLDLATGRDALERQAQQLAHGGLDEHESVARLGEPLRRAVAEDVRAGRVADHDALFDLVDGLAEAQQQPGRVGRLGSLRPSREIGDHRGAHVAGRHVRSGPRPAEPPDRDPGDEHPDGEGEERDALHARHRCAPSNISSPGTAPAGVQPDRRAPRR